MLGGGGDSLHGAGIVEHGPHVLYSAAAEFSGECGASTFLHVQHEARGIFLVLVGWASSYLPGQDSKQDITKP